MKESTSDPLENLERFIENARTSPTFAGVKWSALCWQLGVEELAVVKIRGHRSYSPILTFSTRETSTRSFARKNVSERMPIENPYSDFARAEIRRYAEHSMCQLTVLRRRLSAHQFLERAIRSRRKINGIAETCIDDFYRAEDAMKYELGARTAYKVSNQLESIGEVVDRHRLAFAPIQYRTRLKRPVDGDELTDQGETLGAAKMVSDEVLVALAEISASPTRDEDRLLIRLVDLLVTCGFRIGELLSLPADCIVDDVGGSRVCPRRGIKLSSFGIRYPVLKLGIFDIRWLPHAAAPLARRAIEELVQICAPARNTARWMEANPGRLFPLREFTRDQQIDLGLAAERLFGRDSSMKVPLDVPRRRVRGRAVVRVSDIEAFYLKRYSSKSIFHLKSGSAQPLSQSLVVLFVNQLHGRRGTLCFLPVQMKHGMFSDAISPPLSRSDEVSSLLSGKIGSDGKPLRITSHQFRHWLNTLAVNSGISDLDLAKWMGRSDMRQNEAYKHHKMKVRTEWARQAVLDRKLAGEVTRIVERLPPAEKKEYLDARIQAVHTTPYGLCVHNYASTPCTRHMQCLAGVNGKGCSDLLRVKGDQKEREHLVELKTKLEHQIEHYESSLATGDYGVSNWLASARATLAGTIYALSVDGRADVAAGDTIRPFAPQAVTRK